jgi:fumarylpyruvate hydrolase
VAFVFDPLPTPSLPVVGTDKKFPVNRIFCVGRNYAEHAREMGHDPNKEPPFFFMKSADTLFVGNKLPYPDKTKDFHFEMELVVALKSGGVNITPEQALSHVFGYAVGLDMTRRDLQAEQKKLGRPWEVGKSFEKSAPCGPIHPVEKIGHVSKGAIWLDVDGERRQTADLKDMIWDIPNQIAFLSGLFELKPGDLIYSGTPAGVGAVKKGQRMHGHVDGVGDIDIAVV